jgi:polynucleotide 5'-hydroxyl-kinase GRC3/NOL9
MVALSVVEHLVFGPPFTHPTIPHQAHYIGANNPRSSPSHYLRAIQALVETYRLDLQFATSLVDIEDDGEDDRIADIIPLVVNTMGWTKGLGADLARRIEELVQPTDIFLFDTSPPDGAELGGAQVHILEPITPSRRFTPSDHRALSLLSYFHAVVPNPMYSAPLRQTTASLWSTHLPLCARPPYELTSRLALDRIVLTGAGSEDVVRTELVRVLAGALVALVSGPPPPPPPEGNSELYTPGSSPPDPATSNCLGLALVRGVSSDGSKLQLLTPVPPETLKNARILVMGELGLPVWGWLDFRSVDGKASADVPFLRWGRSTGAGSERRRVRRNIMRRAQM